MVQSLGISIGNANSYVAAGQGGGIEILLNEYSNRSTPSMVSFTDQVRAIGMDASSNQFMNLKNTVYDLMVLLGRPYKDIKMQDDQGQPVYPFKLEEAADGQCLVVIRHLAEERKFTVTQILAMLFTKLRDIAGSANDCVLSCPQFYEEHQKAALIQAALIAGLNPLQVITDMSAVILNYAYYRTTKEDKHRFIAFINVGQSNLQTCIAWLSPKEDVVRILSAESESIGGKDFDRALADHFIKEYNLSLAPKAYLKLNSACEKLKRLLSANANEIPLSVESLISEEQDFTARIDRAKFEELSAPLLERIEKCLRRALDNARADFEQIMAETSEASQAAEVARAAEAGKVAELLKAAEIAKAASATPAAESTTKEGGEEAKQNNNDSESNKEVPMEVESGELVKAKAAEKSFASQAKRLAKMAELKFDLQVVEMVGGSTRIPAIKQLVQNVFYLTPSTTLNTDEAVARGCVLHCATLHPGMKVKRQITIMNSESFSRPSSLTCDKESRRVELELIASDRKYRARTEARNSLEEYIYSERSKLQEGDEYLRELSDNLDWLFSDEGEEASEEDYNKKLNELRSIGKARLDAANKVNEKPADKEEESQKGQKQEHPQEAQQQETSNVENDKS